MATAVRDNLYHDRRLAERRRVAYPFMPRAEGRRVSWGGVFGGVLVALGFLLLMTALGVAVGISAARPGESDAGTLGTGAGIWGGVSLLLALALGGWVSTRIGAIFDGTTGFFEGVLVWVVSVLMMLYFASSGIGMLAGGAFNLVGGAAQALGSVVRSSVSAPDVSGSVDQMIREAELEEMRQELKKATEIDIDKEFRNTIDPTGSLAESLKPPELPKFSEADMPAAPAPEPPPQTSENAAGAPPPAIAAPAAVHESAPPKP